MFAPHKLGDVQNGPELRRAYQSCHAILHANSDTNWHQRIFEAIACARPVLLYGLPEDEEDVSIMKIDLPLLYRFSNKEEMLTQIEKIKQDQGNELLRQAETSFVSRHDYLARCEEILRVLEPRF